MDLENIVKSNIKREGDLYKVMLPSIEGYYESVFYSHEGVTMNYLSSSFSEKFSFTDIHSDIHHIFLMSSICGSIFLRIIDTLDLYNDTIIILKSGKFDTFTIRGSTYFVIIFVDDLNEIQYYTNFENQPIFQRSFESNEYAIYNTLTGMSVYNFSYYPEETATSLLQNEVNTKEVGGFFIMNDLLFPNKKEFQKVRDFLKLHTDNPSIRIGKSKITEDSLYLEYDIATSGTTVSDGMKLIGFLGTHQCILENTISIGNYISLQEVTDLDINMPQTFMPSGAVELLDPGWHKLRKTLMELQYMTYIIHIHIGALKGSIAHIETLNNPHLQLQKNHSTMTLDDLEKIEKTYTIYLNALIALLINSLPN